MLSKIQNAVASQQWLKPGSRLLLAVSGGADSVAMTHALHHLRRRLRIKLSMAHLHHGIRGADADQDERFVSQLARRLRLPYHAGKTDVPARARRDGVSLEMAARQERYDFLTRIAREHGASAVVTAHTADDQVETMLLKIVRGSGRQGLTGIPYLMTWTGVRVFRPMLEVSRHEVVTLLRRRRLAWRDDLSNQDTDFLRNRIRHEILPLLEARMNPAIREAMLRLATVLRDEEDWLDRAAQACLDTCRVDDMPGALDARRLEDIHLAARRRVLRLWLAEQGIEPRALTFDIIERLLALGAGSSGTSTIPVVGSWRAVRRYDQLSLSSEGRPAPTRPYRQKIALPGETLIPEHGVLAVAAWARGVTRRERGRIGRLPAEAWLDREAMGRAALYVRSALPGDRIRPLGMKGSRKLQDVFVDRKTPRDERWSCPVVECRKQIVWVPGYTVARGWEVAGAESPSLHLRLQQM